MPHTSLGTWEPAPLAEVVRLFSGLRCPWWIAGGHAIELAVGHAFRPHGDIDVLLLRRDQGLSFGSGRISERGLVRAIARRRREAWRSHADRRQRGEGACQG
ncbi:nucleotidyltransferase domain-containing protein, partial [Streptomyces niveus]